MVLSTEPFNALFFARQKCYMARNVHVERQKVQTMNAQNLVNDHQRDYWDEQSVSLFVVMCRWISFVVHWYIVAVWSVHCL